MKVGVFFDSAEEMKPFFGAAFVNISEESLRSYLSDAMADVANVVSMELLNDLLAKYRDETLSAEEEALVEIIRKPLIKMALNRHSRQGNLDVTDSGYTTQENELSKRPYQWQMRDFRKECMRSYSEGMNTLWKYLLEHVDDFTTWTDSEEYLYLQQRPINQMLEWNKAGRRIANWNTHYALLPEMTIVWQDLAVEISDALWAEVNDYLLEGNDADMEALMPYIQRYVAHATVLRAIPNLPVSIEDTGLIIYELNTNAGNSDSQRQESGNGMLQKQANDEAHRALCKLKKFLEDNASATKYVGYYNAFIKDRKDEEPLNNADDKIIIM